MPESLKTIRELTVKYQTEGVQKFEADFQRAAVAQDQVSRSGLSAERALARRAAALDVTAKAAQYTSAQLAVLNRGLRQGLVTQAEYAARADLIRAAATRMAQSASAATGAVHGLSAGHHEAAAAAGATCWQRWSSSTSSGR